MIRKSLSSKKPTTSDVRLYQYLNFWNCSGVEPVFNQFYKRKIMESKKEKDLKKKSRLLLTLAIITFITVIIGFILKYEGVVLSNCLITVALLAWYQEVERNHRYTKLERKIRETITKIITKDDVNG